MDTALAKLVITSELERRMARPPDYAAENRALVILAKEIARSPSSLLQTLADTVLQLCHAHSAGISFLKHDGADDYFLWSAISGVFTPKVGGKILRQNSPCGLALDYNSLLLLQYPERCFKYPVEIAPPMVEALLAPFHINGEAVGTIWAIAHYDSKKFDAEDARVIQVLSEFASSAYNLQLQISERERATERALQSEKRFRALVSATSNAIFRMSPDWKFMTRIEPQEPHAEHVDENWLVNNVAAVDQRDVMNRVEQAIKTISAFESEHRSPRGNGAVAWRFCRAVPLFDFEGRVTEWFGTMTDITARKDVEQTLRTAEERLRTVIDNLAVGIILVDASGKILHWNRTALQMHGIEELSEAPTLFADGLKQFELLYLDGTPVPEKQWPIPRILNGESLQDYEILLKKRDSSLECMLSIGGTLIKMSGSLPPLGLLTIKDVTELKKAQNALIQSEKLISVGRLAASIAHEINNPLEAAMNTLFLAASDPTLPDSVRPNLELVDQELRRVAHITKQTLGFYRERGKPSAISLAQIVDDTISLLAPKLRNKAIEVERRFKTSGTVFGIEGEVRQIISNVISNSIDALADCGRLVISVSQCHDPARRIRIVVADNGVGIAPENLKRIFEPFFTTKESTGTGLGLWVTRELIKKQGGSISIRSHLNKGTVFSISLPADRRAINRSAA